MPKTRRFFYGWVIVLCSVVLTALGIGMYVSTNSVFVKPICDAFGFARGQFTFHRTIVTLTGALLMPLYGRVMQRVGVKKVMLLGALVLGGVMIGYSFATRLWHFYLLSAVQGLFTNSISFMSVGMLVSAWFDGKKGLATGIAYSGSGLGGAIMVPLVGQIIAAAGWQWAYRLMGFVGILVLLPVIALLVRNRPEDMELAPLPAGDAGQQARPPLKSSLSLQDAMRTGRFWLLIAAFFFINFFASAANTHSAPYLSDLGYPAAYVSSVISLFMGFLTVGKIILGFVYDRYGAMRGNLIVAFFSLAFPVFALLSSLPAMPWLYAVCIGMASCGVSVPVSILILRYFGPRDFPVIFSFCTMASTLASAISVPAMGTVFDLTGSYRPAWLAFFFCALLITACLIGAEMLHRKAVAAIPDPLPAVASGQPDA